MRRPPAQSPRARHPHHDGRRGRDDAARAKALTDAYTALHPNVTFDIETSPAAPRATTSSRPGSPPARWRTSSGTTPARCSRPSTRRVARRPLGRAVHRQHLASRSCRPSRSATASSASRTRPPWAAASSTTRRSSRPRPVGAQDLGGVRGQQREAQGGRHRARRRDLAGHLDLAAVRARRLLQRADGRPGLRREVHRQPGPLRDTPAALAGFERLQEGFEKGWWQEDFGAATFDDGLNMLAEGKIAQYPMLTFALGDDRREPPGRDRRHRLLRHPG